MTLLDGEPGGPRIEVTATPCRHGPPGLHPIVGDVVGFALRWEGGSLWITGDTAARDAVALCDLARPRVVVPVHSGLGPRTGDLELSLTCSAGKGAEIGVHC